VTSTTLPSTAALPAAIKATLPSAQADLALDLFDELQRYRDNAAGAARIAREARSSKLDEAIEQAAVDIAPALRVVHPCFHAKKVQQRITKKGPAHYGLDGVPDLRTIRRVLQSDEHCGPECAPVIN